MSFKKFFKRTISLLVSLSVMMTMVTVCVFAEESEITVCVSVSKYGEFVEDADGEAVAAVPVRLSGKAEYTIDDALREVHELYYNGDDGYASGESDFGVSLIKLWGDTSGNFGYQLNRGTVSVMGLTQPIAHGDFIDAYINKNKYPDNEAYSHFDQSMLSLVMNEETTLILSAASGYDENWNTIFSPCDGAQILIDGEATELVTDEEGKVTLSFEEDGMHIISAIKSTDGEPVITAPVCRASVAPYDCAVTVPLGAEVYVGKKDKAHYMPFTEITATELETENNTDTYYYELENDSVYNFRVTTEDYVTYGGTFIKKSGYRLNITEEMLALDGKTKSDTDRDVNSLNGTNLGDIYFNINAQGYLKLNMEDTYRVIPLRNRQTSVSGGDNYFIEPDFHYTVINEDGEADESVVKVDEDGLLTAVGDGTAIVLVTYDAIQLGDKFYGSIWQENTGVFVVSVGAGDSGIDTGMTVHKGLNNPEYKLSGDMIDAEHDVIYFIGEKGSYEFAPITEGCTVSVANPLVGESMTFNGFEELTAENDTFSVPLTEGRNIVKIEKDGKAEYQVITAKSVNVTVNGGKDVKAGDEISVEFDRLYHPADKLAGIYNMYALPIYTEVSGYTDILVGGAPTQYDFASNTETQTVGAVLEEGKSQWGSLEYTLGEKIKVPKNYDGDTFTLSGGKIRAYFYGDSFGNHRGITVETGKAPNLNAEEKVAWLGILPDIEIPIKKDSTGGGSSVPSITVKFTLMGDEEHGNDSSEIHTYTKDNLDVWVEQTSVNVPKGSSVADVIKKVLDAENIPFTNPTGDYIESVKDLAEFDNGPYSGWQYVINGKHSDVGISNKTVKNGDKIVLHYTDNYKKEKDTVSSSSGGGGGGSGSKIPSGTSGEAVSKPEEKEEKMPQSIFEDVNSDDWFYDSVNYAYENKLMNGTGDGFEPDSAMTRAMLVTVLFRMDNPEKAEAEAGFEDIPDGEWYTDAVNWAAAKGIVNGISDTEFAPNDNVTREQMAAIFYRYAQHKEYDTKNKADLSGFADSEEISEWAEDAVMWANAEGLINGTSETTISPMETATRAQVATILMRFCENTEK